MSEIKPEDYLEPNCLLCGEPYGAPPKVRTVPQRRIMEKMDEYMSRLDYDGAERLLLYWLDEARLGGDQRGELMIRNELVGHYRKTSEEIKAREQAEAALGLLDEMDYSSSLSAGTTYVNIATTLGSFGDHGKALELFAKAKEIYESGANTKPELIGGLCNNMGLSCAALGRYAEAESLYDQAMREMARVPGGEAEMAITCLNRADMAAERYGMEQSERQIGILLDRAEQLLLSPNIPRDGYYAYVCDRCAASFSYYGYFAAAQELSKRAETIRGLLD